MGTELSIFEAPSNLPTVKRQSKLMDKMGGQSGRLRRIATNTNGTFKRIINGEQVGRAVPHAVDVIIVDMLPEPSRQFYATKYDPDATPTLPDCWSNDGVTSEEKSPNRQSVLCAKCPQNIAGSGKGNSKACRYLRRVAVLLPGDPSGDLYQMSYPAKSLFGEGNGREHPFEGYKKYLLANGEALDTVVTRVMYDIDADTMTLKFKAMRHLTQEEVDLVDAAQESGETENYIKLTVAEADGVTKAPALAAPKEEKVSVFGDEEDESVGNPFDVVEEAEEEAEEEEVAPAKPAPKPRKAAAPAVAANPFDGEEEAEEAPKAEAPTKRQSKKLDLVPDDKRARKLTEVLSDWGSAADAEDEDA